MIPIRSIAQRYILWSVFAAIGLAAIGCNVDRSRVAGEMTIAHNYADYGNKVNVRASDVPTFVLAKYPRAGETTAGPFGTAVERCDGMEAYAGHAVGLRSQRFHDASKERSEGGGVAIDSVQSAVYAMSSPELANREMMAAWSRRGRHCAERATVSVFGVSGASGSRVEEIFGPNGSKRLGAQGSESPSLESNEPLLSKIEVSTQQWRIRGMSVRGLRTAAHMGTAGSGSNGDLRNYYSDQFVFTVGRFVIVLDAVGAPRPFSEKEERRLLSTIVMRATAP